MGRLPVIIIAAAVLTLVTACAASAGPAPANRGADRERLAGRVVSQGAPGRRGERPGSSTFSLCGRAPSGTAADGTGTAGPCSEVLRVPVRVRLPGSKRTRVVYRLRPCWCYRDSGSGGG
jgi:hypothetical protein